MHHVRIFILASRGKTTTFRAVLMFCSDNQPLTVPFVKRVFFKSFKLVPDVPPSVQTILG